MMGGEDRERMERKEKTSESRSGQLHKFEFSKPVRESFHKCLATCSFSPGLISIAVRRQEHM
jgi:hypothetical protein